jgi:hypothetical protein
MSDICDVRLAFHAHRRCAQACQLVHALRLTPPSHTLPHLPRFDAAQLRWYEKMNSIRLDTRPAVQVTLTLRHQGHGFVPTGSIADPAFAASLIDSAKYGSSILERRLTEEYAAEVQPMISTYFSLPRPASNSYRC